MTEPDDCGRIAETVVADGSAIPERSSVTPTSIASCDVGDEVVAAVEFVEDEVYIVRGATAEGGTGSVEASAGITKLGVSALMTPVGSTADTVELARNGSREDKREGASEASTRIVGSELVNAF